MPRSVCCVCCLDTKHKPDIHLRLHNTTRHRRCSMRATAVDSLRTFRGHVVAWDLCETARPVAARRHKVYRPACTCTAHRRCVNLKSCCTSSPLPWSHFKTCSDNFHISLSLFYRALIQYKIAPITYKSTLSTRLSAHIDIGVRVRKWSMWSVVQSTIKGVTPKKRTPPLS